LADILPVSRRQTDALEHLHRLPAKKAVLDPINLRERAFTQEAFDFIGATNHLAVFEQAHHLEVITI
jgi:hypothetical protein